MITNHIHIGGRKHLTPESIVMLQGDSNYTKLYMKDGSTVLVATTLKILGARLHAFSNFFRSSKSFIINFDYLNELKSETSEIILGNNIKATITRRRKTDFLQRKKELFG